jgi:hypothetical protein
MKETQTREIMRKIGRPLRVGNPIAMPPQVTIKRAQHIDDQPVRIEAEIEDGRT